MKRPKYIALLFFLFALKNIYAADLIKEVSGEYFTVYSQEGVDLLDLAYKIKIQADFYLYKDNDSRIFRGGSPKEVLAKNLDLLFKEVSDILDMQLYSYHGDIRIFLSQKDLKTKFDQIFDTKLNDGAFYRKDNNTIYLAADTIGVELLAQKFVDVITSFYFVVMPPDKVKDVLSEHVKYSIGGRLKRE
jgi:hypothetical protein